MINIPFRLMSPRWRETSCNLCIIIGAIVGGIGIVFLFIKGFADKDAWLATMIGVVIFFVFLWVKSIRKKHEKDRLEFVKSIQMEREEDLLERDREK